MNFYHYDGNFTFIMNDHSILEKYPQVIQWFTSNQPHHHEDVLLQTWKPTSRMKNPNLLGCTLRQPTWMGTFFYNPNINRWFDRYGKDIGRLPR